MPSSPEHPEQRNAEIWSTRIQRELLAMTTDNADAETTEQVRAMLPPFCTIQNHALDIGAGTCQVAFQVEIVPRQSAATTSTTDDDDDGDENPSSPEKMQVVVTLDASLPKNPDGSVNGSIPAYPFLEPTAVLTSGQDVFPDGSTIQDGSRMTMDLDWTPSLHLSDAILNLALKIKESVLQKEPFHAAVDEPEPALDDVTKGARRIASSITKGMTKGMNKAFSPRNKANTPSPGNKKKKHATPTSPSQVRMGDEINLLDEPWVDAHGLYSCKAIRRPKFIQAAMDRAATENVVEPVRSPTGMFRSFAQSARSVMEESFLMITESHIIEMKASKLNLSSGTVTLAIPIDHMAKLKFRRHESVSLFFKPAPDDPLIYMCPDAGDAVHQIQAVLKRHGVKGKHTNAAAHRAIAEALQLVQEIQTKELALKHDPTVQRVNEIMDLYRQAAERFEVAGDLRHEEVVVHMRKFLALPLTISILDGSFEKPVDLVVPRSPMRAGNVPEGVVLEPMEEQLEDDDLEDGPSVDSSEHSEKEKENDKAFEQNMDDILKEAQEDLKEFNMDSDGTAGPADSSGIADMAADLDAMMKEADKELEDLMSS